MDIHSTYLMFTTAPKLQSCLIGIYGVKLGNQGKDCVYLLAG